MTSVVLLSGGIDSTLALAMTQPALALSFDYGQTHKRELAAAQAVANYYSVEHRVLNIEGLLCDSALTGFGDIPEQHAEAPDATLVCGRNLVMLSIATAWAQARGLQSVVIGANRDDHNGYPDCRIPFINAVDDATRAGYGVAVWAPLIKMNKQQIVERARERDVPLYLTWSCYRGEDKPCGRCGACQSRTAAGA